MTKIFFEKLLAIEKQKKPLSLAVTYNNQPLTIRGEAERNPLKDQSSRFSGWLYFCAKITLNIKNNGSQPVDTDVSGEPIVLALDIKGKPDDAVLLDIHPKNQNALLGVVNRQIILEHVSIGAGESLDLLFEAWFAVHMSEL